MPSHAAHSISVPTSFDLGFFIRIYFFVSRRHIILFGTRSLGEAAGLSLDKYLVQCSLWLVIFSFKNDDDEYPAA